MITKFFSWFKRRFKRGNKTGADGLHDNPFLIL